MTSDEIICPACGSNSVAAARVEKKLTLPFGNQKTIFIEEYTCGECGTQGDFIGTNDTIIEEAYTKANLEIVNNIIDEFSRHKVSMATMERALGLSQRTLTKWKNGMSHPSPAGTALFKMLGSFPWLLEVADNNYEPGISQYVFLCSAVKEFSKISNQFSHVNHFWNEIGADSWNIGLPRMPMIENNNMLIEGKIESSQLVCGEVNK